MKSPADMKIIQIDITNACHRRCSNCTRFCGHHTDPFYMDFETFKAAVDSLKGFRGIVGIMGGEPTMHPEFEKFMEYYRANVGYDDFSTVDPAPSADFMRHILANTWHYDYSNHRGIFTSVTPRYYKFFELIQDTFGYQQLNDHSNPSMHQTLMVTRKELGVPDDEWIKMRDRCWIQNLWSASITPKGAFFCEVAAAMDATLGGPGGWKIEPGWWHRKPEDFKEQLKWCEMCSACLPMPTRDANDDADDVSPVWAEKLKQIASPKLEKELVNTFDPVAYQSDKYSINQKCVPYMDDQEERMGKSRGRLLPQKVTYVLWLSDALETVTAQALVKSLRDAGRLEVVALSGNRHEAWVREMGLSCVAGSTAVSDLGSKFAAKDWVLMTRDCAAPQSFHQLVDECVFNPGVLYQRILSSEFLQFFNLRAYSLKLGGDLFDLPLSYPEKKKYLLETDDSGEYRLSSVEFYYRRAYKRINWLKRKIQGKPVPRGPIGELKGNKVVG